MDALRATREHRTTVATVYAMLVLSRPRRRSAPIGAATIFVDTRAPAPVGRGVPAAFAGRRTDGATASSAHFQTHGWAAWVPLTYRAGRATPHRPRPKRRSGEEVPGTGSRRAKV